MKKIIIIGGYGNGTVVQSTVEDTNAIRPEWEIIGFLNDRETEPINGVPVLGKVEKEVVAKYISQPDVYFFYYFISVKLNLNYLFNLHVMECPTTWLSTIKHYSA